MMGINKLFLFLLIVLVLSSISSAHDTGDNHLELPPGVQKLKDYQRQIALSMTLLIAFIGGIITFTSPCGFVIFPIYFSYALKERKKSLYMSIAFCLGLTIAFVILGLLIAIFADIVLWKTVWKAAFAYIGGAALIFLGVLTFMGLGLDIFAKKCGIIDVKNKTSFFEHFTLGFMFALGWTPCAGAILSGIFLLTVQLNSITNTALLLFFYSLGISLPLLIVSYFADRLDWQDSSLIRGKKFRLFGIKTDTTKTFSALFLIIIGLIMLKDKGTYFFSIIIPSLTPWTMSLFTKINLLLIDSPNLFRSNTVNIAGSIIILYIIWKLVRIGLKKE